MPKTSIRLIARDIGAKFKHPYSKDTTVRHVPLMNDALTLKDKEGKQYVFHVSSRVHHIGPSDDYFDIWLEQSPYSEEILEELGFKPNEKLFVPDLNC